jgi:hypothetical protein
MIFKDRLNWKSCYLPALVLVSMAVACGLNRVYLTIDSAVFQPSLSKGQFSEYSKAGAVQLTIYNRAQNTAMSAFISRDGSFEYGSPGTITRTLATFLTNCYRSMFSLIGVIVSEDATTPIPKISLEFTFWDDVEMRYSVILAKANGQTYQNSYLVTMPAPTEQEKGDYARLKKRIYEMIERSFTKVLEDPGFKAALLKTGTK